jgi:hypothetical protein
LAKHGASAFCTCPMLLTSRSMPRNGARRCHNSAPSHRRLPRSPRGAPAWACGGSCSAGCSYMRPPGPRTTNQYDPTRMTNNVSRARPNSKYSNPGVASTTTPETKMTAKRAKEMVPVIITVLRHILSILLTSFDQFVTMCAATRLIHPIAWKVGVLGSPHSPGPTAMSVAG